jgi:hypothetical protein
MTETTTFELRTLNAKDIAPMTAILHKIGFKEFRSCFENPAIQQMATGKGKKNDKAVVNVGLTIATDIAGVILEHYSKCQDDLFKFLASLSGKGVSEVENLPIDTFAEMIIAVVKKEEFKSFFSVVSKLFK